MYKFALIAIAAVSFGWGYTTITAAQLHQRLVNGDTLQVIDVREFSEYTAGHFAEPAGQLPLTPACLPWNSGIFRAQAAKLPKDIDLVLHCQTGVRAGKAAALLDSLGFTRVYSAGGYASWTYETRKNMFGDGSGAWIRSSFSQAGVVTCDSATLHLTPAAFAGYDSMYCEVHFAYGKPGVPQDEPGSDIAGLYRVTALDRFGFPAFTGDSLSLADTMSIDLAPRPKTGSALPALSQTNATFLKGKGNWQAAVCTFKNGRFHFTDRVFRKWYNVAGFKQTGVLQPSRRTATQVGYCSAATFALDGRVVAGGAQRSCQQSQASRLCIKSANGKSATSFTKPTR